MGIAPKWLFHRFLPCFLGSPFLLLPALSHFSHYLIRIDFSLLAADESERREGEEERERGKDFVSFFLLSFLSLLLDIGMIGRDFGRGLHLGEGDKLGLGHSQIQKSGIVSLQSYAIMS